MMRERKKANSFFLYVNGELEEERVREKRQIGEKSLIINDLMNKFAKNSVCLVANCPYSLFIYMAYVNDKE